MVFEKVAKIESVVKKLIFYFDCSLPRKMSKLTRQYKYLPRYK